MRYTLKYLSILLIIILASACGSRHAIQPGDSLEVAFEKAMALYERERYSQAVDAFETVLSIARGTEMAADAQYHLAQSHFENRSYLLAASEFRRFSRNYTTDPRQQEAEFMEAYSHYQMSPKFNLDQTETYNALNRFQLFITRYPESEYTERAAAYMDELRDKLARKKFHAAEMYLRIGQYESAAIYYGLAVENYPESKWAERALAHQIQAYAVYAENSVRARQQERFDKAVESYERYVQLFPRGENRSMAEEQYNRALEGIADLAEVTAER